MQDSDVLHLYKYLASHLHQVFQLADLCYVLYFTISSLVTFWRCLKSWLISSNLQPYPFSASLIHILLLKENRTHASSPKIILHTYLRHCLSFSLLLRLKCKSLSCILDSSCVAQKTFIFSVLHISPCLLILSQHRPQANKQKPSTPQSTPAIKLFLPPQSKFFRMLFLLTVLISLHLRLIEQVCCYCCC